MEMMCVNKKRASDGIKGEVDRLSELPEHIIHHIKSFLPLKDEARTCILSKTWKRVCSSYPILYFHRFSFENQFLHERKLQDCYYHQRAQIYETIKNTFMNHVDHHLLRVNQQNLSVRKITLDWYIFYESDTCECFSRVDHWMELVYQAAHVKELCFSVRANVKRRRRKSGYRLQQLRVLAMKGLQCLTLRMFEFETSQPDNMVRSNFASSLQQIYLSNATLKRNALDNFIRYCPVIKILEFHDCCIETEILKLSTFPKLLKKFLLDGMNGISVVDIRGTYLESFKCNAEVFCEMDGACTSIRELSLGERICGYDLPDILQDLTETFPLLEEARIIKESNLEGLRVAKHYHLRTLYIRLDLGFKKVYVFDCPNLTSLTYQGNGLEEIYVDCSNLRQFYYVGTTVPTVLLLNLSPHMEKMNWEIMLSEDIINTMWFQLTEFIQKISPRTSNLELFSVTFIPEQLDQSPVFPQGSMVNLTVRIGHDLQNQSALVDGSLWSTRPSTLTIWGKCYDFMKHLCDKLSDKPEEASCDKQFCSKHWWHHIKDFNVETSNTSLDIQDIKENLHALLKTEKFHFRFHWSHW